MKRIEQRIHVYLQRMKKYILKTKESKNGKLKKLNKNKAALLDELVHPTKPHSLYVYIDKGYLKYSQS